MRSIIALLFFFSALPAFSQRRDYTINTISLPPELSWYDNQFSGLYIQQGRLYLMSESRLQDKAEPKIYSLELSDIEHKLTDTAYVLPFRKYHLQNMETLRKRMDDAGDDYEGLEAMVINGSDIYFSVETATPSNNCYLLKGKLDDFSVTIDTAVLIPMKKPVDARGRHIYNAGFEAMTMIRDNIYSFFEYNFFPEDNYVKMISPVAANKKGEYHPMFMQRLPFRITDITKTGENKFTAINYFYKGSGDDEVYRVSQKDKRNDALIRDESGYHNYCRLVDIDYSGTIFTWTTVWEFPKEYSAYNWEGLAAYKNGYFIMNDKYTPAKPYSSTLLYISEKKQP